MQKPEHAERDEPFRPEPKDRTASKREPGESARAEDQIDADVGLSGAIQQGAGALANVGKRAASDLSKPDDTDHETERH